MIEAKNLTIKYPGGKGIFGVSFTVKQGEAVGYLGPNGAGKTTTIRAFMGFMRAEEGSCTVGGLDCFSNAPRIHQTLGYIPGEIAFPEGMTGEEYLSFVSEMRGTKDKSRCHELLDLFELSPKGSIKKFSKGMKQKLGIVAAFMHRPDTLILDEPTGGLDPLMQNRFVELVLEEKKKGTTILMSSHMFEEIERTCDNVLMIKEGTLVAQSDIATLKSSRRKGYVLQTKDAPRVQELLTNAGFEARRTQADTVETYVKGDGIDVFVKTIAQCTLTGLEAKTETLEDVFMHYYAKEGK